MPISVDQVAAQVGTGTTGTITGFTPASGAVVVVFSMADNFTVTGITFNGVSLTQLSDSNNDGAGIVSSASYISVTGADGGSHDVTATYSGGTGVHRLVAVSFTGVNTSSNAGAHRTIYQDGTGCGGLNLTVVDSVSGDMVLHHVANWGTDVTGGNNTTVSLATQAGGTNYDQFVQRADASGGSTSMTATGGQFGVAVAFALVPSSSGPGAGSDSSSIGMSESSTNRIAIGVIEETS